MIRFTLKYNEFMALGACMGKSLSRHFFNGVCFFVHPDASVVGWSTYGVVAACHKLPTPAEIENPLDRTQRVWVGWPELDVLGKLKLKGNPEITIEANKEGVWIYQRDQMLVQQMRCIPDEDSYPDCHYFARKWAEECTANDFAISGTVFPFSALNQINKVAKLLKTGGWQVRSYGNRSVGLVELREDFWAVVVQVAESAKETHKDLPEWMTQR